MEIIGITPQNKKHLKAFDNTQLSAINTCPTWGLVRYHLNKTFSAKSRSMALEAGGACHEFFAAVRLLTLGKYQGLEQHMEHHGKSLFGDKWESMYDIVKGKEADGKDWSRDSMNFCLEALYNSGFYDDANDQRRTMSNLEAACIGYFDEWDFNEEKIFVADENDPTSFVGIEVPFDVLVKVKGKEYRFTGRMDGIHVRNDGELEVQENKTASRLGDAWEDSFMMSHQVTGYCVAGTVYSGKHVQFAKAIGLAIPRPKTSIDAQTTVNLERNEHMMKTWMDWFEHTVEIFEQYKDDAGNAPKYTHSCNRYFTSCAFIPLCVGSPEERTEVIENEMEVDAWNPLD